MSIQSIRSEGLNVGFWTKRLEDQIKAHVAWKGDISEAVAEKSLQNQPALTYLLRKGEKEDIYFVSFVDQDHVIQHKHFTLEADSKIWYYQNNTACRSNNFVDVIPRAMHCNPNECNPLSV